jgi:4-hydroxy-4-methyl-2-oxoglutarate aldolase
MKTAVPDSTLQELRNIDSATIANAIEMFKVRGLTEGYASMELRCRFPELPSMVGYAVTCIADSTSPQPAGPNKLSELFDAVAKAPKPVVVAIQHTGPDRMRSCFAGDVVCSCLTKLSCVGLVTDGGVRDIKGIRQRAPGFQVFTPGTVVSHGSATILDVGIPVSVCGLTVRPGDLLHGDESGLVMIPLDIVEQVAEKAKLVHEKERKIFDFLKSDSFGLQELKSRLGH